jgi:glycosyltransferase involved in cell wall biosynthesis
MIVKNEEKHLARCLSSVKDVVDEIVVVDTGSSDETIKIAESFNAKIFHFNWVNDFSAARNFSLSKCTGNWILYLDADEELNPNCIEELIKYKSHSPAGVYCTVKSLGSASANGSVMKYPRLFANVPGVEFVGKVHEQIIDSLRKIKIPLVDSEIEIIHHGYAIDVVGLQKKKERNLDLLLSNENKKSNTYDKLKLIQTYISLDKYDEAEVRANSVINSKLITAADLSLVMFYLAQIKYENNDLKSANNFALKSYKKLSDKPELNYLLYLINNRINNIGEAFKFIMICISSNKQLLENKSKIESENILDQTDLYLRAINLSLKLDKTTDTENLITELSKYISSEKKIEIESVQHFFENLFLNYSIKESESKLLKELINPIHLNSVVEIIKFCKDDLIVISILNLMLQSFPESATIYKNLAQMYINSNQEKGIELFNKSLQYEKDPSTYINLISIYISKSDYEGVRECFSKLQANCSDKPQIKQKIDILREKLNPILTVSAS